MIPPLEIWHARHIALARAAAREPEPAADDEELAGEHQAPRAGPRIHPGKTTATSSHHAEP